MTISNGRLVENRMERKKSAASGFVSLGFGGQGQGHDSSRLVLPTASLEGLKVPCAGVREHGCAERGHASGFERT